MPTEIDVAVNSTALAAAVEIAGRDPNRETGGILIGFRHETGIYVTDMIEVRDDKARHAAYRRRHAKAQAALSEVLAGRPEDSYDGYVGEWHTHPAPSGPSWVDKLEMRRISKRSKDYVALIVLARASKTDWIPFALGGSDGHIERTVVQVQEGP